MAERRWNRRNLAVLIMAGLFLAGCSASQIGGGGSSVAPPVKGAAAKFAFTPVDGVPVQVLQLLSNDLNSEARRQQLNVVPLNDPGRVYQVRGFISAVADGQSTKLVYVWDVVDNNGTRLHRITGQEAGGRPSGADPWTGIGRQTVSQTAGKTIAALVKWVNS